MTNNTTAALIVSLGFFVSGPSASAAEAASVRESNTNELCVELKPFKIFSYGYRTMGGVPGLVIGDESVRGFVKELGYSDSLLFPYKYVYSSGFMQVSADKYRVANPPAYLRVEYPVSYFRDSFD